MEGENTLRMKTLGLICLLLFPAIAQAEPITSCEKASWAANTEPDLAGYRLYVEKDGTPLPVVEVGKAVVSVPCLGLKIVEGSDYSLNMSAFDLSNNESERTDTLVLSWPDTTAPSPPSSVCVHAEINGVPREICLTIK